MSKIADVFRAAAPPTPRGPAGPAEREYDRFFNASLRFDYFLAGLASAVIAYSIQSFDAADFPTARWLAQFSWASLALCVLATIAKARCTTIALAESARKIKGDDDADPDAWHACMSWTGGVAHGSFYLGFVAITLLKILNW